METRDCKMFIKKYLRKIFRFFKIITSTILYILFYWWKKNNKIILMYHSISKSGKKDDLGLCVSLENFKKQIVFLREQGYDIVPLRKLVNSNKKKLIAITFDDGYADNYRAYLFLKKMKIPATIFVSVDYLGKNVIYPRDKNKKNPWIRKHLSWGQIREMLNSRLIEIGSHGLVDLELTKVDIKSAYKQILNSKKILEKKLNYKVLSFSYPHGKFNQIIKEILKKANYKIACTTIYGDNKKIKDSLELKRVGVYSTDNNLFEFNKKIKGAYNFVNIFNIFLK